LIDMEITFDPRAHALGSGIQLNEHHQLMPDSEWILWARRETGIEDLFQYYHKQSNTFVLAKWIYHPEKDGIGILMELEAFDQPLDWNPPTKDWLRDRLRPAAEIAKTVRRGIRDTAKAKQRAKRDGVEEKHRVADWLKRQGKEDAASSLRQRQWSNNASPEFESFTEDLQNSAKGRIVTGG
tara:strand:- start:34356 stop:34901 length:546 start_codon:yes stop_codon:yes gene_type:complete